MPSLSLYIYTLDVPTPLFTLALSLWRSLSRPLIPISRILHAPLPINPQQENPLNGRDQAQRDRVARPEPVQLPAEPKGRGHTNRHGDDVVAKQLDIAADLLAAEPAQDAVAASGEGVEELERGAQGQSLGDEVDDARVAGEELGDVVPEAGEEDHIEEADGCGGEAGDAGAGFGGGGEGRANEVGDAGGGGDGEGEGDSELTRGGFEVSSCLFEGRGGVGGRIL